MHPIQTIAEHVLFETIAQCERCLTALVRNTLTYLGHELFYAISMNSVTRLQKRESMQLYRSPRLDKCY